MESMVPGRSQDGSWVLLSNLSSACSEWCLIVLLFANALLSYLATKFARFCKLQTPCLVCCRLDHILGNEKLWFCGDLVCIAHKLEISCLAYCRSHRKLVYIRDLCESCLLSSATLVGDLRDNNEDGRNVHLKQLATSNGDGSPRMFDGDDPVKVPLLEMENESSSQHTRLCSCCSESFRNISIVHRMIQGKKIGQETECGISKQEGLSKRKEKPLGLTNFYHSEVAGFDHLSHIGYSELKITSDSESEVPFSDDDDKNAMLRGANDVKKESVFRCQQPQSVINNAKGSSTTVYEDTVPEKLIHQPPTIPVNSMSDAERQQNADQTSEIASSAVAIGHGLEEINWNQIVAGSNPASSSAAVPEQVSAEVVKANFDIEEIGDSECVSGLLASSDADITKGSSSTGITKQVISEPGPHLRSRTDHKTSLKRVLSSLQSPRPSEIISARDNSRTHEDLKILISQISSNRGFDVPWGEMSPSPRLTMPGDESKICDVSSSTPIHYTGKRFSLEREYSGLESYDATVVSEVEGESSVDRLKRQVELDKKSMNILYKELEEERSASAIAANEAMAMINRLQEEKAAMQMEALQYLRMMEEQAEYDQEAIQKLNDALTEREKDILDLEAELESCKKRFEDKPSEEKPIEALCGSEVPDGFTSGIEKTGDQTNTVSKYLNGLGIMKDPLLDFEDEKAYISEYLRTLEKRLQLFSSNVVHADGSRLYGKADGLPDKDGNSNADITYKHENGSLGHNTNRNDDYIRAVNNRNENNTGTSESEGEIQSENDISSLSCDRLNAAPISVASSQSANLIVIENHKGSIPCSDSDDDRQDPLAKTKNEIISLEVEVLHLNDRFKALEANQKFLQHTINSLKYGNDGLQFIQEISSHLRALQRIVITKREQAVA
ncbi:probable myosin-binding protein 4 [Typha angustifolia]|uniref:probable myosin-binding protein 4 n=1 Tax=Typha angustifolia TaxID=59011 RepID=UPI003C2CAF2B